MHLNKKNKNKKQTKQNFSPLLIFPVFKHLFSLLFQNFIN